MKSSHLSSLFLSTVFCLLLSACSTILAPAIPSGNPGDILFQDDFADYTSGWDRVINDGGIMDYDIGGYRILVRQPSLNYWSTPGRNFRDVRVEADVTKLNGPGENRAGLICRYQRGDYYFFIISNDGYYAIGKFIGGQTLLLGQTEMQFTESIRPGSVNHLRADCIGDTLAFYVNDTLIAGARDSDFSTGDVGVLAGAFNEPGVDVLFEHFAVIQP